MSQATLSNPPAESAKSFFASCCPSDSLACLPSNALPWLRLVIGLFVAAQTMTLGLTVNLTPPDDHATLVMLQLGMLVATMVVAILLGWPLAFEAARQLARRRLTMELLFLAGVLAATGISVQSMLAGTGPVYFEVVNVLLVVYSAGHAINARNRRRALDAMQSFTRPIATARLADSGRSIDVINVNIGDRIRVFPGETIPIDGIILDGQAMVRQTPFTGEWLSAVRRVGDIVLASSACEDGTLLIQATAPGAHRRIDQLADLIEKASNSPTSLQRQADRFVRWFLPIVSLFTALTFLYWTARADWHVGLFNALAVLLVACPCAAGLATPLTVWSVIGQLAARGLVLRSGDAVERLAAIDGVIFDKTGTLSDDALTLCDISTPDDPDARNRILAMILAVEQHSTHPVAKALGDLPVPSRAPSITVLALRTLPARGIEADLLCDGKPHAFRLLRDDASGKPGLLTLSATLDNQWAATLTFREHMRDSASQALAQLQALHLAVRIMTGDSASPATLSDISSIQTNLAPEQKHQLVLSLRNDPADQFHRPLFVGDGLNDAAAMAASHVSIALACGAPIAIETASATLHGSDLTLIPHAINLSRRAVRTVRGNLHWAVFYNLLGILAAATGHLHPVLAALLMSASSALVGWRSFHLISQPRRSERKFLPYVRLLHHAGTLVQGLILAFLADLAFLPALAMLLCLTLACHLTLRAWNRFPAWLDMTFAMLTLGGLGMNFGWWVDQHFTPAIHQAQVETCCAAMRQSAGDSSHWMYWGMLLLGVPGMYLLRRTPETFSLRRWCCIGPLVLGVPGMCLGMWTGAQLAARLTLPHPSLQVLASYVLMMAGMAVGMLIPHLIEPLFGKTKEDSRG